MTDVRALQIMLDGGVTDPRALLAALPSGTTEDAARAVAALSAQALEEGCDCGPGDWCDGCGTAEDWRLWHGEHREDR